MPKGKFIVIDGGEGSGKSSVIRALQERLPKDTVFTREPGGTPLAEKIREMLLSDEGKNISALTHFAMFWAARRAHIETTISPALESGKNVICDRFDSSTFAYQIWGQNNWGLLSLFDVTRRFYVEGDAPPSLYIYLDVDPKIGRERTKQRGKENHFDEEGIEFRVRVREGFLKFFSRYPHKIIDSNRTLDEVIEETHQTVLSVIS